jgi:hypothetical protein
MCLVPVVLVTWHWLENELKMVEGQEQKELRGRNKRGFIWVVGRNSIVVLERSQEMSACLLKGMGWQWRRLVINSESLVTETVEFLFLINFEIIIWKVK